VPKVREWNVQVTFKRAKEGDIQIWAGTVLGETQEQAREVFERCGFTLPSPAFEVIVVPVIVAEVGK
jgi:hypothetical protein